MAEVLMPTSAVHDLAAHAIVTTTPTHPLPTTTHPLVHYRVKTRGQKLRLPQHPQRRYATVCNVRAYLSLSLVMYRHLPRASPCTDSVPSYSRLY
jgi:hypothetical protein